MTGQGGDITVSNLCVGVHNTEQLEPDRGMMLNCPIIRIKRQLYESV